MAAGLSGKVFIERASISLFVAVVSLLVAILYDYRKLPFMPADNPVKVVVEVVSNLARPDPITAPHLGTAPSEAPVPSPQDQAKRTPPPLDPRLIKLADFKKRGLTAASKAELPVAIVSRTATIKNREFARDLSAVLAGDFNLVDQSEAFLTIDVSGFSSDTQELAIRCVELADTAQHPSSAAVTIGLNWSDGTPLMLDQELPTPIVNGCVQTVTMAKARAQLLRLVKDYLDKKTG